MQGILDFRPPPSTCSDLSGWDAFTEDCWTPPGGQGTHELSHNPGSVVGPSTAGPASDVAHKPENLVSRVHEHGSLPQKDVVQCLLPSQLLFSHNSKSSTPCWCGSHNSTTGCAPNVFLWTGDDSMCVAAALVQGFHQLSGPTVPVCASRPLHYSTISISSQQHETTAAAAAAAAAAD
jgi:hypothetical protein